MTNYHHSHLNSQKSVYLIKVYKGGGGGGGGGRGSKKYFTLSFVRSSYPDPLILLLSKMGSMILLSSYPSNFLNGLNDFSILIR